MMVRKICDLWLRKKTKNFTRIPLFTMVFNYRQYKEHGKAGSCMFYTHPDFAKDEYIKEELGKVVDYIRDNYDLDTFTRV